MPMDFCVRSLDGAQWGRLDSAPQSLGLQLGRFKWPGLESAGGFSAHISGAPAGMTQRLGSAGLPTGAPTCGFSMWPGLFTPCPGFRDRVPREPALHMQTGSIEHPERAHSRMAFYDLSFSLIVPLPPTLLVNVATDPPRFKGKGTQTSWWEEGQRIYIHL